MTPPPQYPGQFYPQQQPTTYPEYRTPPKPPLSPQKRGLLLVSAALGIFLVTLLTIGIIHVSHRPETGTAPGQIAIGPRSGGPASSDEKQIRQTIAAMAAAAQANDYKKMVSFFCAKYRTILDAVGNSGGAPDLGSLTKSRNGPTSITRIEVDGDDAVVYTANQSGEHNIQFKKERGDWKFCPAIR